VALVAGVQFYVALESSLLLPLGPLLCRALSFGPEQLGYLNSAFLIAAAIAGLAGSLYLDRFERRAALGVALGGLAICTALAGLSVDLETVTACRFLAGLFGGPAAALGLAVIGDAAPAVYRARAIGAVAAGSGMAIILGVPLALTLADWIGWRPMLFFIGAVGAGLAIGAFLLLPRAAGKPSQGGDVLRQAVGEFAAMLRHRDTVLVLSITALVISSTLVMAANLAPYFVFNLGIPQTHLKYIWLAGGVFGLISSQGCSALAHRFGPTRVLWALSGLTIITYGLLFMITPLVLPVIVLFCGFMVCANGRILLANTIASLASRAENRGRFMSLVSAANQTSSAAALILASLILRISPSGAMIHVPYLGAFGIIAAAASPALASVLLRRNILNSARKDIARS